MVVRLEFAFEGLGWFAHGVPSEPKAGLDMFGVDTGTVAYRFVLPFLRFLTRSVDKAARPMQVCYIEILYQVVERLPLPSGGVSETALVPGSPGWLLPPDRLFQLIAF